MAVSEAIQGLFLIHTNEADNIRFPFFALNTKLRAQVQGQARMYIRTHPGAADLTIQELREPNIPSSSQSSVKLIGFPD